jgi:hypothetical protein
MAKAENKLNVSILMGFKKLTEGTVVYEHVEEDGSQAFSPIVRSLYIAKRVFKGEPPKKLTLTFTE